MSNEECDHIIELAKKEGLQTSQTLKEGVKQDMMALGKNTKKHFDVWDPNKDGQIDTDEVHLESKTSALHPVDLDECDML